MSLSPSHYTATISHPRLSVGNTQNRAFLTILWRDRWSGILQLSEGGRSFWITISDGGPVNDTDRALILRALLCGGVLRSHGWKVDGTGSSSAMADLLLQTAPAPEAPHLQLIRTAQ